jgi:hypothetical protein
VLGAVVTVVCAGELAARMVNTLLDEDLVPMPSRIIGRISLMGAATHGSRFAARSTYWAVLAGLATVIQIRAGRLRPNPYIHRRR